MMVQHTIWHWGKPADGSARTLRDAMYGEAVGDALGVPFEFRARGTFTCTGMAWDRANGLGNL